MTEAARFPWQPLYPNFKGLHRGRGRAEHRLIS